MLFKDIIGREDLKQHLIHTIQRKRISHAQLFLGNEGVGSLALAIAYVRYIFCENKTENDACGVCRHCTRMDKLEHPDVHFSFPVQLKANSVAVSDDLISEWRKINIENPYFSLDDWYAESGDSNKSGTIAVKEADSISKKLSLKSFEGGYKVLIMWMPELLNIAASNKLLKFLEEPPPNTLFILCAESTDRIISTILSRTQIVKVLPPKETDIANYLVQKYGVGKEQAENFAHLSDRNVAQAIHLMKNLVSSNFNIENFVLWMRLCYKRDVPETIDWVEKIARHSREEQKSFLRFCLQMFRNSIVGHYTNGEILVLTSDQKAFLDKFAPFINHNNIVLLSEAIEEAHYHIERNANPKILFMDLSLKIFLQLKKA